jgi:hypothetical protein
MRSRRRNRGKEKKARLRRVRQPGELVVLINDSWAYNRGEVPAIQFAEYLTFSGNDKKQLRADGSPMPDRNGDSLKINLPNKSAGVFLGHTRVRIGENWRLVGGYRVLVEHIEYVVQPGYVHFVLDGNYKTAYGEIIAV